MPFSRPIETFPFCFACASVYSLDSHLSPWHWICAICSIFISSFIPAFRVISHVTLSQIFSWFGWMQVQFARHRINNASACIVEKEQPPIHLRGNVYYYSTRSVLTVIGNYPSMLCTNNPFFNDDDLFPRDIGHLCPWMIYTQVVSVALPTSLPKILFDELLCLSHKWDSGWQDLLSDLILSVISYLCIYCVILQTLFHRKFIASTFLLWFRGVGILQQRVWCKMSLLPTTNKDYKKIL